MRIGLPILPILAIALAIAPRVAPAQYWVEFKPGTCKVGPPPACVAGHWHPVYLPERTGVTSSTTDSKGAHPVSEVSTDVEYESFNIGSAGNSVAGQSIGGRAMYLRTGSSGIGFGIIGTYNRATENAGGETSPATNTAVGHAFLSADLGRLFFSADQRLSNSLTLSGGASASSIKSDADGAPAINTYGPFASTSYQHVVGGATYGATLSYSVATQSLSDGTTAPNSSSGSWAFGLNAGYALTHSSSLGVDYYNLNNGPKVVGGTLTQAFSESFAITLGARTLLGLTDYSNYKFTLGTVFRAF